MSFQKAQNQVASPPPLSSGNYNYSCQSSPIVQEGMRDHRALQDWLLKNPIPTKWMTAAFTRCV